jgi:hypothetical protein
MKQNTFKKNFKGTEGFNDTKLNPSAMVTKSRMSEIAKLVHLNSSDISIKAIAK